MLLVNQKNDVFAWIKEKGFEPKGFKWGEFHNSEYLSMVPYLTHLQSDFKFYFMGKKISKVQFFDVQYAPSATHDVTFAIKHAVDWNTHRAHFHNWLNYLKEQTQPDLWEAMENEGIQTTAVEDSNEGESFTQDEIHHLASSVDEFKQLVRKELKNKIENEKLINIEKRLDYLTESAGRLSKKDWQLIAIGLITNIVSSLIVSPESMNFLLAGANGLFGWAFVRGSDLLK